MVDGRQKAAWVHTVAVAAGMNGGSKAIIPMIPARYRERPRPKTAAEESAESERAFRALENSLTTMTKQWGR